MVISEIERNSIDFVFMNSHEFYDSWDLSFGRYDFENMEKCLPLVHVMLGIVQPHSDFDGIAFANPMEYILHFERI